MIGTTVTQGWAKALLRWMIDHRNRESETQTNRQTFKQTNRDRETERQRDRETERNS